MAKSPAFISLGTIRLDPAAATPLYRQLYQALQEAILTGQLRPGTRLPSTRALAVELAVSRNTIINAFEQLIAEGYLLGQVGAGTCVAHTLPDDLLRINEPKPVTDDRPSPAARSLSHRGRLLAQTPVTAAPPRLATRPFRQGVPAFDAFPKKLWQKLITRRLQNWSIDAWGYGHPAGYGPLRAAIAAYLGTARGARCEPEQVLVVSGAQQGIDLTARLLLDPGDVVWVENPGYLGGWGALVAAGARPEAVPVDDEGLDVAAGAAQYPLARLAYVTPSHQYPLGATMSLTRRLALLRWAEAARAWIVEDDYDSEYRYSGPPLASLQGLDRADRVIYIGTFSKVLFPALRLGYVVVPPNLVDAFTSARALVDRASPTLEQAALTDFIVEGHFARHIRRIRTLYAERQAALVEAAQAELAGWLEIKAVPAGLHLVGRLPAGSDDRAVSARLAAAGIEAMPLSAYASSPLPYSGLILGYAAFPVDEIRATVRQMARLLTR